MVDGVQTVALADHGKHRSAKAWFIGRRLCHSPATIHIGNRRVEVRYAEIHHKAPIRVTSMDADLVGRRLKPAVTALSNGWNVQPNICSRKAVDFEESDTPISMNETSAPVGMLFVIV